MDTRYAFLTEWFDPTAQLLKNFVLTFHVGDNSVELYDVKNRRVFLKRCPWPNGSLRDLFLGSVVSVYSRQLKLVDYADEFTRSKLGSKQERTLALIKPDAYLHMGKIIDAALEAGLTLSNLRTVRLTRAEAEAFYAEHAGKPFFSALVEFMTSDTIVAMELIGDDAIHKWRQLIGPTSTERARAEAPQSLRARFGTDNTRNACHGSDSPASARNEISFFFGSRAFRPTAQFNNCTCALIKPSAAPLAGRILDAILEEGFEISAAQLFRLTRGEAEEFLEVYKGVVPEYNSMVDELCAGASIALEVRAEDAVPALRRLCGPPDPAIAKHIAPRSLRARFGQDKVKNAIHCTDLPEDGQLECQYFFHVLQTVASTPSSR